MNELKSSYSFLSLFSGCGGMDSGFFKAGFKCLGAYDIDPLAVAVYNANFSHTSSVYDLSKGVMPPLKEDPDVVISGSPCQGFSTLGLRNLNDPRNSLLVTGGKIAIESKAKVFIAENVMGSISGDHKKYWLSLIELLKENGYLSKVFNIQCSHIGLAQTRKRVILIAWKGEKDIDIVIPTLSTKNLFEVLLDIDNTANHEKVYLEKGSKDYLIAEKILQGKKLCDVRGGERSVPSWQVPSVFGECTEGEIRILEVIRKLRRKERVRSVGDADPVSLLSIIKELSILKQEALSILNGLIIKGYLRSRENETYTLARSFNGKYRRLTWNGPSMTVDTNFGNPKYFLHPEEQRGFTVREAARIQGFEDAYTFFGSTKEQFRLIGNAVPPPLSYILAKIVRDQILPKLKYAKSSKSISTQMVA